MTSSFNSKELTVSVVQESKAAELGAQAQWLSFVRWQSGCPPEPRSSEGLVPLKDLLPKQFLHVHDSLVLVVGRRLSCFPRGPLHTTA